jgi:hypothetical protein
MPSNILKWIIILFLVIVLAGMVYFFRANIGALVGLSPGNVPPTNFIGENITFGAGGKTISIPPKFSEEILDLLKKNLNQTGGLPLRIERKGNPLPFGIP